LTSPRLANDPEVIAAFDLMIAGVKGVERKGATMPYVAVNGNMYAMISKADVLGLRLSSNDLETFLATYNAKPFEGVPGFVSKEFGAVPRNLFKDAMTLQTWFKLSHGYASKLPPKPTR
jgi:hypothetical protein